MGTTSFAGMPNDVHFLYLTDKEPFRTVRNKCEQSIKFQNISIDDNYCRSKKHYCKSG